MVESTVGVPLISPVVASMESPLGNPGEIDQEMTAPPLEVGETEFIGVPLVRTKAFGL